jgi:hypothetical protein
LRADGRIRSDAEGDDRSLRIPAGWMARQEDRQGIGQSRRHVYTA